MQPQELQSEITRRGLSIRAFARLAHISPACVVQHIKGNNGIQPRNARLYRLALEEHDRMHEKEAAG